MENVIRELDLKNFEDDFNKEEKNLVAQRAVLKNGIVNSAIDEKTQRERINTFSVDVNSGDVTNQRSSGRCWMFAGLNVLRVILRKKLNVKNIELSQAYLQFYDKLEKANFFLERARELAGEPFDSRLNVFLLDSGIGDGGHFTRFTNLVKKYGVVPSVFMPDRTVSTATSELNTLLTSLLARDRKEIREAVKNGTKENVLRTRKEGRLDEIYRVLEISIGTPVKDFVFEYKDKDDKFHRLDKRTPKQFFDNYIGVDLDDYVSLCDAPIERRERYQSYTCKYVNNVIGGDPVVFFNVPLSELKKACIESLKGGDVIWFGSDVLAQSRRKDGYLAEGIIKTDELFSLRPLLDKSGRLTYRSSFCNHARTLTGVNLDDKESPDRWKVENSWGDENGKKGYYIRNDAWFNEYVYEVFVNKKYINPEIVKKFEESKPVETLPFNTLWKERK